MRNKVNNSQNYLPSIIVLVWTAFLLSSALFGLSACSTLGYENVDTTRKAIVVASAEVRAANLLLQDLIIKRAITESQARESLANLQTAKDNLQTALNAVDLFSDPATANTNLQRANSILSVIMTLLAPFVEDEI